MTSGVSGSASGGATISAGTSTSFSVRLLRWTCMGRGSGGEPMRRGRGVESGPSGATNEVDFRQRWGDACGCSAASSAGPFASLSTPISCFETEPRKRRFPLDRAHLAGVHRVCTRLHGTGRGPAPTLRIAFLQTELHWSCISIQTVLALQLCLVTVQR